MALNIIVALKIFCKLHCFSFHAEYLLMGLFLTYGTLDKYKLKIK